MKVALITGILGQDGSYLAKFLLEKGYTVYGMVRSTDSHDNSNTDYLKVTDKIKFISGDLTDATSIINVITSIKPDEIYNLAAQSSVESSWKESKNTLEVNATGVLNLLEAVREYCPQARIFQASSAEMFGGNSDNGIQTEDTRFQPRNPYATSKLYAFWIMNNYKERYGLYCANGILFNHESPIRGINFVTRKISDGVAKISLGISSEIQLGNIDSKRDWGFAGDYVEAMYSMLQQDLPDNYIIATGQTHSIREFLDIAFNHVGIKDWENYIKIDQKFMRTTDFVTPTAKIDKALEKLQWAPKTSFQELVKMMVDADMDRLKKL